MREALETSTEHQARARVALSAALATGPSHAYLFRGPRGAGKSAVARAFAAEILAAGAADEDDARRRALVDPSPHPDLVWLTPRGAQHMVEEVRERVIRAASYRPFESEKRVFVVEAAEAMRDESQNALLKTLEEPPDFVHLILLSSEPALLLETISSRCQPVDFAPLPSEAVEAQLGDAGSPDELATAARLSAGDVERARLLLSASGRQLRAAALDWGGAWGPTRRTRSARCGVVSEDVAGASAECPASRPPRSPPGRLCSNRQRLRARRPKKPREKPWRRTRRPGSSAAPRTSTDEAKRAGRRRRTEVLDLGLELFAELVPGPGRGGHRRRGGVFNRDRLDELKTRAADLDPSSPAVRWSWFRTLAAASTSTSPRS